MTAARRAGSGAADAVMTRPARGALTTTELADRLGVHPGTLRNWRYKGEGPNYIKVGGAIRYPLDDVDAYLTRARVAH